MRVGRAIPAAAAAALLALVVPAAGQQAPPPPSAAQSTVAAVSKARDLVKKGRYVEALGVLRPVAARRPVPSEALFLIGVAGIEASRRPGVSEQAREALLDAAIEALRTMLVRDPGLVRARLELARAFFLKGEDTLAKRHFEQVLAGKPPAAVALNVNRFLSRSCAHASGGACASAPRSRPTATSVPGRRTERSCSIPRSGGSRSPSAKTTRASPASGSRPGRAGSINIR